MVGTGGWLLGPGEGRVGRGTSGPSAGGGIVGNAGGPEVGPDCGVGTVG